MTPPPPPPMSGLKTDSLLIDRTDAVVTLTLNRPDAMNALDVELKEALRDTLASIETDRSVRAVVLTGAGKAFCVGQDLREHARDLGKGATELDTVRQHYNPIAQRLASLPKPVIAAVRGTAAGAGASLALLADFRIGGPRTTFLMAFANVGLAADTATSWTLPRLVGHAKATELLMLAEPVRSDDAARMGLLTQLVDDDAKILPAAQEFATQLAAGPTIAYAQIKRQLRDGSRLTLAEALEVEADAQTLAGGTQDHRASIEAFVAKQPMVFTGR